MSCTQAQHYNSFENLTNGIIARNSSISISDAFFVDITPNIGDASAIDGNGIFILNGKYSKIKGNGEGEVADFTHHFDNCRTGIFNSTGGIEVTGITMNEVETGISLRNVENRSISLKENIISAENTGILLDHCAPRIGDVYHNTITINGDGETSMGIEMNNYPIPVVSKINL